MSRPEPEGEADPHLAAEVHRLSNLFQLLASMLAYRRQGLTEPLALEQIEWAEGVVHTLLLQTPQFAGYTPGEFGALLTRQLTGWQTVCASKGIDLEFRIEDAILPMGLESTITLIVHEALTNAVKHAFPNRAGGRIQVAFGQTQPLTGELSIRDDGIGLPETAPAEGSGLALIRRMVGYAGGSVSFENDGGLSIGVRFSFDATD